MTQSRFEAPPRKQRDWNKEPPAKNPSISEALRFHDDCEICMCFDCDDVWTGIELVALSPENEEDRTHCPRCGKNLLEDVWQHVRHCLGREPKSEAVADKLTESMTLLLEGTQDLLGTQAERETQNVFPLIAVSLMSLAIKELDEIRLSLKKDDNPF